MKDTILQSTVKQFANTQITKSVFTQMKSEIRKLIGHGISKNYYDRTFGRNGWMKSLNQVEKFVNDAKNSTGSFSETVIKSGHNRMLNR